METHLIMQFLIQKCYAQTVTHSLIHIGVKIVDDDCAQRLYTDHLSSLLNMVKRESRLQHFKVAMVTQSSTKIPCELSSVRVQVPSPAPVRHIQQFYMDLTFNQTTYSALFLCGISVQWSAQVLPKHLVRVRIPYTAPINAGVAEWQTRQSQELVLIRVGSSPTTRTKEYANEICSQQLRLKWMIDYISIVSGNKAVRL